MLNHIIVFLGVAFIFSSVKSQNQDFLFRKISPLEGFTYGNIKTIAEDNKGFIWFGTEHGLYLYNSETVEKFSSGNTFQNTIPGDNIEKILKDTQGRLWVLSVNTISILNEQNQSFEQLKLKDLDIMNQEANYTEILENSSGNFFAIKNNRISRLNLKDSTIQSVNISFRDKSDAVSHAIFDSSDIMWVGTNKGFIYNSQPPYHDFQFVCHYRTDRIQSICQDNATFWVGYEFQGVDHINQQGLIINYYNEKNNTNFKLPSDRVRSIVRDENNRIWIGTYNGIALFSRDKLQHIRKDFYNNLPHNSIHSLFIDSKNGLWAGTWSGGLAYLNKNDNHFLHFNRNQDKNSLYNNIVSSFCEDKNGNIWVATEDGGLNKFVRDKNEFIHFNTKNPEVAPTNIKCIVPDEHNRLWIGTYGKGLWTFDLSTETFFKSSILDSKVQNIYAILPEKNGIWIGSHGSGLFHYNYENNSLKVYQTDQTDPTSLSSNNVRTLLSDSYGGLWVGTQVGLNYKPKGTEGFNRYFSNNTAGSSISNNQIFDLFEDSKGFIWIATGGGGANCYNPANGNITIIKKDDGLPGNNVFGILEDKTGNIWFSTENGLSRYNAASHSFKNFTVEDGLQGKQFNPSAAFASSSGEFLFGGPNGFNLFHPENLSENPFPPKVFITNLEINNQQTVQQKSNLSFLHAIYAKDKLELDYQQNSLTLEFVSNNFIQPSKNEFRYRMLNYQDNWITAGTEGKAIFTKIPPGNYTFEVIGSNNDGIWSSEPAKLQISIKYPLLRSKAAYFMYFLILVVTGLFIRKEITVRNKLKNQLLIEKVQRENEEKLHQMKLQFFTNISHEFRTPLTLILSPLDVIMNKKYHDSDTREHLKMIQRNAQRLKALINQIIDFRKVELDKMVFSPVKTDIVALCEGICNHYEVYARDKLISFSMVSAFNKYEIEIDPDKFDKVVFNLLSNAFKFTPENGEIMLKIEESDLTGGIEQSAFSTNPTLTGKAIAVRVTDSGQGISKEDLPLIFERFNKGTEGNQIQGTGIGLHLSKEYARLHHGAITVQLTEKGVTFSFLIPQNSWSRSEELKQVLVKNWSELNPVNQNTGTGIGESLQKKDFSVSILVVEDNLDMQKQIKNLLMNDYKIITASNGNQGYEMAREIYPDLILSDVVMPGMSGIDLCRKIKDDIHTSHIPLILLTALTETDKQVDGLETGADAYLIKPFENKILRAQIANLLRSREKMKKLYRESEEKWANDINLTQRDKNLVEKSVQVIEKNLLNPNFSVEQLADELGVSRSSLHRKMRVLTNQSATEFIRYVRMKKALKLMKEGDLNIDEIGFAVGFNSHSYFSQCFKKLYGKTPTEYLAEIKINQQVTS